MTWTDGKYIPSVDGNGGKTVAESLGIEVPDNAPGGQPLAGVPTGTWSRKRRGISNRDAHAAVDAAYEGFGDIDGYNKWKEV